MGANVGYIYVRGEFIRERERLQAAVDQAYEAKLIGKNNVHGWDFDLYRSPWRRRLYLRRRNRAAGKPRGQEGPAAAEAAVPGQCRPLWLPDDGQQCRVRSRSSPDILRRGAPWFAGIGRPNNTGTKLFCISGHVEQAVQCRRGDGHPVARADRDAWRRRARRLGQSAGGHPRRLVGAAGAGRRDQADTPMDFDGCRDKKSGLGTAAVIVMDKSTDIIGRSRASRISTSTRAAASARRAARAWAGCGAC